MSTIHPEYDTLAARIEVSNLHKETDGNFTKNIGLLYSIGIISNDFSKYVYSNAKHLNSLSDYSRDYSFDYFGIKTLKKSYLLKDKQGNIIERPQDMWLRVAAFIHQGDLEATKETYALLSQKYFTHATPTLFNAGTIKPQLSSCFLIDIDSDSIGGIYKTLSDCAKISQSAGGIGISINKIRADGSPFSSGDGHSDGIIPMLRVFDATARYVNQKGKRKGSIAMYLEPWHSDINDFLDLKKNTGKEELRARDLFYALWIPDLFMNRVEQDQEWSLFDPAVAYIEIEGKKQYLYDLHSEEFELAYQQLELEGKAKRIIPARELWEKILTSQTETGIPYILYKDACNRKSNQKNLGTIKSSNLCSEVVQYTSPEEIAVCNLASISLPNFIIKGTDLIDYEQLYFISGVITRNLNKVIDANYYPVPEAKVSNFRHRPIGIGVQGLADLFAILKIPFASQEAKKINKRIFETIYKGAVDASIQLAQKHGAYSSYVGSPASLQQLQFDLWGLDRSKLYYDWTDTFNNLRVHGLRNSLLLAPMPTASTAQILGNNEAFEAFTSNIYTRRTLAGEFIVVNKYLVKELLDLGLWNDGMRQRLMAENGSVQNILSIPPEVRERYKTVWEIPQRDIIDMAADRGPFICQSQSMNIFMNNPNFNKLNSMHFYGWKRGLKTGSYYLRSQSAVDAIKFTLTNEKVRQEGPKITETQEEFYSSPEAQTCSLDDPSCESCGA